MGGPSPVRTEVENSVPTSRGGVEAVFSKVFQSQRGVAKGRRYEAFKMSGPSVVYTVLQGFDTFSGDTVDREKSSGHRNR